MTQEKKLIPYSVYLPAEYHKKIKDLAKKRLASSTVRDAICMIVDGNTSYQAGYKKAINEAIKLVKSCPELKMVAIQGKHLDKLLADQLNGLKP